MDLTILRKEFSKNICKIYGKNFLKMIQYFTKEKKYFEILFLRGICYGKIGKR